MAAKWKVSSSPKPPPRKPCCPAKASRQQYAKRTSFPFTPALPVCRPWATCWTTSNYGTRSEEHTSELQSRGHLVCRLLLEKKKNKPPPPPPPNRPTPP